MVEIPEKPDLDLVGLVEMQQMFDVGQQTVYRWRTRSKAGELPIPLPDPDWTVSGSPIWRREVMEKWSKDSGRPIVKPKRGRRKAAK